MKIQKSIKILALLFAILHIATGVTAGGGGPCATQLASCCQPVKSHSCCPQESGDHHSSSKVIHTQEKNNCPEDSGCWHNFNFDEAAALSAFQQDDRSSLFVWSPGYTVQLNNLYRGVVSYGRPPPVVSSVRLHTLHCTFLI